MPTLTSVRSGRATALLAGFQSAKGTPVTDFTASNAWRLWTTEVPVDPAVRWQQATGMAQSLSPRAAGAYKLPQAPAGEFTVIATPESVEMALRSNFGAYAAGSFTLASQIDDATRRLTLGWVENVAGGTQKLVRLQDAFLHRVGLHVVGRDHAMLQCAYAARRSIDQALNAGGVTLPADPMTPGRRVFPGDPSLATFVRDPAGAAQQLYVDSVSIVIDQGLIHRYSMSSSLYEVYKRGLCRAFVSFTAEWSDETWTVLANAQASTKQRYRLTLVTDTAPVKTLTINLYEVAFNIQQLGHRGQQYVKCVATAEAGADGSGNFVTISLA